MASAYNFTEVGNYKVESSDLLFYEDEAGNAQPIHATVTSAHQAKLGGSLLSAKRRGHALEKRASFTNCSASRKTSINTALTTTMTYLSKAITYLNGHSSSTKRYTTWFGEFSVVLYTLAWYLPICYRKVQ